MGFCEDLMTHDWHGQEVEEWIAEKLQKQEVTCPGFEWRNLEPPAAHMEDAPFRPSLQALVWSEPEDNTTLPRALFAEESHKVWQHHGEFGAAFRNLLTFKQESCRHACK